MSDGVVREAGSLFQEAGFSTIKSYLYSLLWQGRHDDLRTIYNHFLIRPECSRAAMLIACYRSLNLYVVGLYAAFDREIAFQLVQLAQALYAPQILDSDEQRDVLILDLEEQWEWLSQLDNAELFPASFQVLLDELCPGIFDQMVKTSSVSPASLTPVCSPLRLMVGLQGVGHPERTHILSEIGDQSTAEGVVRLGLVDARSLGHIGNPLINEAYLAACLL